VRLRTRRESNPSGTQRLPSAAEQYPTPLDSVEEDGSPYQLDLEGFTWDQLPVFPPIPNCVGRQPRRAVDNVGPLDLDMINGTVTERNAAPGDGQWFNGNPSLPSVSPPPELVEEHIPAADSLQGLISQVTTISAQAISATSILLRAGSAPPTVSSPHVNEAFEGTRTLVSIINHIVAMASRRESGSGDEMDTTTRYKGNFKVVDFGGLVLTTLACHQHLLAFFRAICDSIERCIESVADERRPPGGGLHSDGPPSTAQFTMVLQLLVHLINRLDRCLFPGKPSSPVSSSSTSIYGGISNSSDGMELAPTGQDNADVVPDTAGVPSLAQALVRAMPDDHVGLRRTILRLQARMEKLEAF
jgi:hypothetical protein